MGCPCPSVVKCFVWLLDQESAIQMQDHLPFVFCEVITWHVSIFAVLHQCEPSRVPIVFCLTAALSSLQDFMQELISFIFSFPD